MVTELIKNFRRDERGITFVEAMLVLPIVLIVITAMVECGMAVYQWNQATKAVQIGARLAAVSSPIVENYDELSAGWSVLDGGGPILDTKSVSCGPGLGENSCNPGRLERLLTGSDSLCDSSAIGQGQIVGMCDIAPFIGVENIFITYHSSGLGYVGRPGGAVTNITVELRNLTFDFLLLDALIPGLAGTIEIPAQPVSITSEDLSDTST